MGGSEEDLMGKRRIVWMTLVASALSTLGLYFGLIPYLDEYLVINRKTGQLFRVSTYYAIYTSRTEETELFNRGGDVNGRVPMTAKNADVYINRFVRQYPWVNPEDATVHRNQHGDKLLTAFSELFNFDSKGMFPDEFYNRIIMDRIKIWNSDEIDNDPDAVIKRIKKENRERAELFKNMTFLPAKP